MMTVHVEPGTLNDTAAKLDAVPSAVHGVGVGAPAGPSSALSGAVFQAAGVITSEAMIVAGVSLGLSARLRSAAAAYMQADAAAASSVRG